MRGVPGVPGAPGPDGVVRVCFVCTGNICRSPMADVVLRAVAGDTVLADGSRLSAHLEVTSAGTGSWHAGEPMDPRALAALEAAGYRDHGHVARGFDAARLAELDLVVGLARRHTQTLKGLARARGLDDGRLVLLRAYDRSAGGDVDVPDPYYGSDADFAACLAMVEAGCRGLAADLAGRVVVGPDAG